MFFPYSDNSRFPAIAVFLLAGIVCLTPAISQAGEPQLFSYDDGTSEFTLQGVEAGSWQSVMFWMEHPAEIHEVQVAFSDSGPVELHLWKDGGGNDPLGGDLVEPYTALAPLGGGLVTWTFDPPIAARDKPGYIHAGAVLVDGGPGVVLDSSSADQKKSAFYSPDEPRVKKTISDEDGNNMGNFIIRIKAAYTSELTQFPFEDATDDAGLVGASRPAWGDYDRDGDDDLLVNGKQLFRNDGGVFTDVSVEAGLATSDGETTTYLPSRGGIWGDFDNDGCLDFFGIVSAQGETDVLMHNDCDGTFTRILDGAPSDEYTTEGAAWGDMNGDGWIDLYVANYQKPDTEDISDCYEHKLWKNNGLWESGQGAFEDVSEEAGLYYDLVYYDKVQCGRGVAWADYDNDGDLDIFVANYRLDPDRLWENDGTGLFFNTSFRKGVAGTNIGGSFGHGIGCEWADVDRDGYFDLAVGNLAHPRFIDFSDQTRIYLNEGPPDFTFADVREASGVTYSETHSDVLWWDYDNDGWEDLYVTGIYTEYPSFLYHRDGETDGVPNFTDVTYPTGAVTFNGWGAAAADVDLDGDLDLMTNRYFKNNGAAGSNHWLQVKLVGGSTSNTSCIGCRVVAKFGDLRVIKQVEGGKSMAVQNSFVQHFGLGGETSATVQAIWQDGSTSAEQEVSADQRIVFCEQGTQCQPDERTCMDGNAYSCFECFWEKAEDCPEDCQEGTCTTFSEADGDSESPPFPSGEGDEDTTSYVPEVSKGSMDNGCSSSEPTSALWLWFLVGGLLLVRTRRYATPIR